MYWKLRIPLLLCSFGVISGFVQRFPHLFFVNIPYLINSAIFVGLIGFIFTLLEKTRVNEKEVHFSLGAAIILFGITFDYLMV
ncbi:hypothetical protein K7887_02945 [Sutcliffiella horikoshii]|uniref:hypothetical protein n=1 Tax=Sutcliffiella horikoshii TaxID=79883 RepID=UPI001CBEBCAA|nr:hypothetical protein [Sutcliffiella horikoshii]UAL47942.1 hypothetical protein K7887_02945 [Sutcliffiella horikoshii]